MGLSGLQLGLLGSSFAWVYGLLAPLAGNLADRISRKTAILGGLCAWSVVCAGSGVSANFTELVSFRGAQGLGESIYYPAAMSMISDYHGAATRSRAMGLHQTSVYAGTIAGGFFAALIGERYGWRFSVLIFGAMGVLLSLASGVFCASRRGALPTTIPVRPLQRVCENAVWPVMVSGYNLQKACRSYPDGFLRVRQLCGGSLARLDAGLSLH